MTKVADNSRWVYCSRHKKTAQAKQHAERLGLQECANAKGQRRLSSTLRLVDLEVSTSEPASSSGGPSITVESNVEDMEAEVEVLSAELGVSVDHIEEALKLGWSLDEVRRELSGEEF